MSSLWDYRPSRALALGALGGLLVISGFAAAQNKPAKPGGQIKIVKGPKLPATLVIYRGDSLQTSGLTLANWGSGVVDEDPGKIYSGTESIKLTTHGMYQGGSLAFTKPIDLSRFLAGKYNYLTVTLLLPQPNVSGAGAPDGGLGGFSGFPGSSGPQGSPGFGGRGGGGLAGLGQGGLGSPGGGRQGGQVQTQKNRQLENLRIVLVTTGGKTLEAMLPVANATTDDNQWKTLSIPLSAIPNLSSDDAQIQAIRLFGDAPATLNIGSIGVVEDPTPITIEPINDKTVQRLAKYQYLAIASAGVSPVAFSWDWDAADGIQDETQGHNVTHVFRKASADDSGKTTDFIVTVTASDPYNIKAPVKTTFKVHVTP